MRHWNLHQRAARRSRIDGNNGKDIPELMRRSGFTGTRNTLTRHAGRSGRQWQPDTQGLGRGGHFKYPADSTPPLLGQVFGEI